MDVGVFTSSFWIRNPRLAPETRLQIGRIAGLLDMGPRTSLILMLPVGFLLTAVGNWGNVPSAILLTITAGSVVWLWAVWQQYAAIHGANYGSFFTTTFRRIDMGVRVTLAVVMIASGALALVSPAAWLNWKISLFGVLILAGVGIRLVADQFPIALSEIGRLGSTTEREARLNTALLRAYPFVLSLWAVLVVMTSLA